MFSILVGVTDAAGCGQLGHAEGSRAQHVLLANVNVFEPSAWGGQFDRLAKSWKTSENMWTFAFLLALLDGWTLCLTVFCQVLSDKNNPLSILLSFSVSGYKHSSSGPQKHVRWKCYAEEFACGVFKFRHFNLCHQELNMSLIFRLCQLSVCVT